MLDMVSNILIEVMATIAEEERAKNHQRQAEGIAIAKDNGVSFGRPKLVKPEGYETVMGKVVRGEIKAVEAMHELGLRRTSYYKLRSMYPMFRENC